MAAEKHQPAADLLHPIVETLYTLNLPVLCMYTGESNVDQG